MGFPIFFFPFNSSLAQIVKRRTKNKGSMYIKLSKLLKKKLNMPRNPNSHPIL